MEPYRNANMPMSPSTYTVELAGTIQLNLVGWEPKAKEQKITSHFPRIEHKPMSLEHEVESFHSGLDVDLALVEKLKRTKKLGPV